MTKREDIATALLEWLRDNEIAPADGMPAMTGIVALGIAQSVSTWDLVEEGLALAYASMREVAETEWRRRTMERLT